jgi:hypothetical protein
MTRNHLFECWVRSASIWSDWAKPVLFAHWNGTEPPAAAMPSAPDVNWGPPADGATAIILDLPGAQGVAMGLALAQRGYQPVPLYNAAPAPAANSAVVDVDAILHALVVTAPQLSQVQLPPDAPPAFMLDADRRFGAPRPAPGAFDNRSVSFATDFPSANTLLGRGIKTVMLVLEHNVPPQQDLAHTLRLWQKSGIAIEARALSDPSRTLPLLLRQPTFFGWMGFRLQMLLGLHRNPLGGFGGTLPEASAG